MQNNEIIQNPESSLIPSPVTSQTPLLKGYKNVTFKRKAIFIITFLVLINLVAWIIAILAFRKVPSLFGTAALAYTLGLKHAVDADHLAAIDNVTRKLLFTGKKSVSVGLFFSLGHSTIVVIASLAIALTATAVKENFGDIQLIGGLIGTCVSASFLFIIGIMNIFVLISIHRALRNLKSTGSVDEINLDVNLTGCMGRIFAPMFNFVDSSWKMYPLGVLFGFGFDTSTEVALLGVAAFQANKGLSIWLIMIFPLLFTSGMALIDTLDGILMSETYSWALVNPVKKLYYNFIVTLLSIIIALAIGLIEIINILGDKLNLNGPFWDLFSYLSDNFFTIGCIIITSFIITRIIAKLIYKFGGYDKLELQFIQPVNHSNEESEISTRDDNIEISVEPRVVNQSKK
ncbi:16042_t:CDS:1 [Cetraspora pellucida]|uniref:Nickel/cobalt efflux system n=1 Tax=Cetraspora pellucida TaxID=1433469 RepID=A0A9N9E3J4_9GLOM|nr:16042_t:CDS:1 [Cetraspora pellucida]